MTCLAHFLWGIEGVNCLLLVMPAKLIVPTLRKYGAKIGKDVQMHSPLIIHNAWEDYSHLEIGDETYFGKGVFFDLKDKVSIGNHVTVSMQVSIITHLDVGNSPLKSQLPSSHAPVRFEDGSYLGARVTVLQGVTLGRESAVAAGALVREDVPERTLVAGVPANVIRKFG